MKIMFFLFAVILLSSNFISAVSVDPYQILELPQLTANHTLDLEGLQRTYLYCSWHIDSIGEEAVLMNSTKCPATQQSFTFEDSQVYSVRIDYANIGYSGGGNWDIVEIDKDGELIINYDLSVPEPPEGVFNAIFNNIIAKIRGWLCQFFPGLGFCS